MIDPAVISAFCGRLHETPAAQQAVQGRAWGLDPLTSPLLLGLSPQQWAASPLFADRVTVPLWGPGGWVGFRGRTWRVGDNRPKAVPYPSAASEDSWPFGLTPQTLEAFTRAGFGVVVEGEFDALALWGCGIPAVATCRTSIAPAAARYLADAVDGVVIWADNDREGWGARGAVHTAQALQAYGVEVGYLLVQEPQIKDVEDYLHAYGPAQVQRRLAQAVLEAAAGVSTVPQGDRYVSGRPRL